MLDNVSKAFTRKTEVGATLSGTKVRIVLKGVDLAIDEGEMVCLLGRNGSGKTTLIRIISGLLEPDGGEAKVCGFDTIKESREARRHVGVMLNAGEGGFQPRLSAMSNLEYYAALYGIPMRSARTRIRKLLDDIGLGDRHLDQIQSYSSGMRRRLALVRALLPDPQLLLLDEPTLGVDPWSTRDIHGKLRELRQEGKTIFCTTNNLSEAGELGEKVLLFDNGQLRESKSVVSELE